MFARLSIGIWLALLTVAAIVVVRARYVADMSAFLPHTPTSAQQMLVEQLQEGPASRLILMAIEGGDAPARERLSRAMTLRLKDDAQFLSIVNGEMADLERTQEFVFAHRYLLSDRIVPERLTVAGLRAAIEENLQLLSSPLGLMARGLFVRDPTGETLQVVSQLERSSRPSSLDGLWVSRNGQRALLVAQTRAAGSDTDGQQRAVDTLRRIFEQAQRADAKQTAGGASLRLAGPGVFAVQARDTIKREAVRLSILSALLIAALLLVAYRSLPVLLLGLLPVLSGAVAGVAAVALGFGVVHGITLGFGVTLIGESVDYSIYLLIQAYSERQRDKAAAWTRTLWPTIRLGLLASVCGFASLLPSTFPGLAQLGLYSIAGLVSAALVTRFVLPHLLVHDLALRSVAPLGQAFARTLPTLRALRVPILIIAVIGGLIVFFDRGQLWNAEISALSPIVAKDLALDGELRADLGAPDVRGMVLISAPDPDTVLQAAEHVSARLDSLVLAGDLAGFDSPSRYLPSLVTQETRRRLLPSAAEMRARLAVAVTPLPIRVDRLAPFLADLERARVMPLLQRSDLEHTALAGGYDALMTRHGQQWHGLLPLQAPTRGAGMPAIDIDRVRAAIDSAKIPAEVVVFDIKRESDALYAGYLSEAIRLSLAGFVAIWILLHIALRSVARVARVIVPLMLAVLLVMSGLALAGQALNILHLIGMLLVIAVGSNYALFFDRETSMADPAAAARTLASLLVANLATVIGFGVLAFSTVPVLAALGSTVAPGALLALLFSAAFAHRPQPTASTHEIR